MNLEHRIVDTPSPDASSVTGPRSGAQETRFRATILDLTLPLSGVRREGAFLVLTPDPTEGPLR